MRKFVLFMTLVAFTPAAASGCVWIFDRPPGRTGDGTLVDNGCTSHYNATVADAFAGTLSLVGGGLGLLAGQNGRFFEEGFTSIGVVGIAGALMHYFSAASNDVAECKRAKAKRSRRW